YTAPRSEGRVLGDDWKMKATPEAGSWAGMPSSLLRLVLSRKYAEFMDHPSDLGVLYHLNARAILGFDLVCQAAQNIVNYHSGKPYLRHVPWERLFPPDLSAS